MTRVLKTIQFIEVTKVLHKFRDVFYVCDKLFHKKFEMAWPGETNQLGEHKDRGFHTVLGGGGALLNIAWLSNICGSEDPVCQTVD